MNQNRNNLASYPNNADYLLFTGTMLEDSKGHKVTYVERVENMILKAFDKNLPKMYMPFYAQLVLTAVAGKFNITNEMVHDAWAMATIFETNYAYHKSLLPYSKLTKEVQDLDTIYTKKLNEVSSYLSILD